MSEMTTWSARRRWTSALVLAALPLVGCTALGGGGGDGADRAFHPTGPAAAWMADGYADGAREALETPGVVCGFDPDHSVVVLRYTTDDNQNDVRGVSLASGEPVWKVLGGECQDGQILDGGYFTMRVGDAGTDIERIDVATGEITPVATIPEQLLQVVPVAASDDATSFELRGADLAVTLAAIAPDGSISWRTPLEDLESCVLLGSHFGCERTDGETAIRVIDAENGDVTVDSRPLTGDEATVQWFTDGFTLSPEGLSMSARTVKIYDFDGTATEDVKEAFPPSYPTWNAGVFYPFQDATNSGAVDAVSPKGEPLATWTLDGGLTLLAENTKLPDDELFAASASGDAFLLSSGVLVDAKGETIATYPAGTPDLQVIDGVIVQQSGQYPNATVKIHVPQG